MHIYSVVGFKLEFPLEFRTAEHIFLFFPGGETTCTWKLSRTPAWPGGCAVSFFEGTPFCWSPVVLRETQRDQTFLLFCGGGGGGSF